MAKRSLNARLAPPITAARASAAPARPANIDADTFAAFRVFSGEAEDMVFVLSPEASPAPPYTHPATFAPQQPAQTAVDSSSDDAMVHTMSGGAEVGKKVLTAPPSAAQPAQPAAAALVALVPGHK
jgi:hypothetical protein